MTDHTDCRPEGESIEARCSECKAPTGQQCKPDCSAWTNILHVCGEA